jgi:DNA-directed RNA polymerase specialized sigma24 family protein
MSVAPAHILSNRIEPELVGDLARVARRKVDRSDVDDVVQATLLEILSANETPATSEETRRFAFFVVRQKIADVHRRRARDQRINTDLGAVTASASTTEPSDFVRWVHRIVPEKDAVERTLGWMVREAEGEALADIARAERMPATAVRQRVSRLRRLLRERWVRDVGAMALVLLTIGLGWVLRRSPQADIAKTPDVSVVARATSTSASSTPRSEERGRDRCDPPYTIDPSGRRKYRLECLAPQENSR